MSSTNGSGRPAGSVSIPVQIIRESTPNNGTGGSVGGSNSRNHSPYRTLNNDSSYTGFSDSPPWTSNSTGRFQPRHSPGPAYDRVISNSQFNQPMNSTYQSFQQQPQFRHPNQQMYEPGPSQFSRSSEDLLSSPFDSMRYSNQQPYSSLIPPSFGGSMFRNDSDFVQPNKYSSPLRRSFDALNDFPDMQTSFPTTRPYTSEQQQQQQQPYYRSSYQTQPQQQQQQQQTSYPNQTYINPNSVHTNEYTIPVHHYHANNFQGTGNNVSNDRSRSPNPPRGGSPARPSPTATSQQQQEEPELKMAKDTDGPIPMPAPASSSSPQSQQTQPTDQQVPSTDTSASTNIPSPQAPPPEHVRDPNAIALEKLEQIKQNLDALEIEVDAFTGSSRNERAYKALDEQALKIMIRCDELVDVSADIKEKRKEMIRNVQRILGKLESKVPATPAREQNSNPMETTPAGSLSSTTTTTNTSTTASSTDVNEQHMASKLSSPPRDLPDVTTTSSSATTQQSISA